MKLISSVIALFIIIFPAQAKMYEHLSKDLNITPGRGIDGVVEIGMSLSDLRQNIQKYDYTESYCYSYDVDTGTTNVEIHVEFYELSVSARLDQDGLVDRLFIGFEFAGTLSMEISLSDWKDVHRQTLIKMYGALDSSVGPKRDMKSLFGSDHAWREDSESDLELLLYYSKGILFDIKDGSLSRIVIKPIKDPKATKHNPNEHVDLTPGGAGHM